MTKKKNKFYWGVHYEYPFGGMAKNRPEWFPQNEKDWEKDLKEIRKTGFNAIRIRIGFDSDLDDVAFLIRIAQANGLDVVFGFATFYTPDWFHEKYPDAQIVDRIGKHMPVNKYDYMWQRCCIDHPQYNKYRNKLIKDCVTRFKRFTNVVAWDVHNEPNLGLDMDYPCYCGHTVRKYRRYLRKLYGNIKEANRALNARYKNFEEIKPPPEPDAPLFIKWRSWREFSINNLSEFLLRGKRIIKNIDRARPVTLNFTDPWNMLCDGQDWWLSRKMDFPSLSLYTDWGTLSSVPGRFRIDFLRSLNRGKPLWILETNGGPNPFNPFLAGKDINLLASEFVARGIKGIFMYRWDALASGPEPWMNGLVEPDNFSTNIRKWVRKTISELKPCQRFLLAADHNYSPIAIYLPRDKVASPRDKNQESCSAMGLHALLDDLGYNPAFITAKSVLNDPQYKVIVVPALVNLDGEEKELIKSVISSGRAVLFEPNLNDGETLSDQTDWLNISAGEIIAPNYVGFTGPAVGWYLLDSNWKFSGYAYHKKLVLKQWSGRKAASFQDNEPALIKINLPDGNRGEILFAAFPLGWSYYSTRHRGLRRLIKDWLLSLGILPEVEIECRDREIEPQVMAKLIEGPDRKILFIINRHKEDLAVNVKLPKHGLRMKFKLKAFSARHVYIRPGRAPHGPGWQKQKTRAEG